MKAHSHWLVAFATVACIGVAQAAPVPGQGTWETTLQARDLYVDNVTDAYYDTDLNITWMRSTWGAKNWFDANYLVNNLVFGGFSDWRLPTVIDTGTSGCNISFGGTDCGFNVQTKTGATVYSELAHLFHVTLGNLSAYDTSGNYRGDNPGGGWGLTNTGDFQNMQSDGYWLGRSYPLNYYSWAFDAEFGSQTNANQNGALYVLLVRPGDVAAASVPEPQALVLALTALGALVLVRRRRPH